MRAWFGALLLLTLPFAAMAIEEPTYEVIQKLEGAEVRQYAPYVVAQVRVTGPAERAGNEAFPILAGYIFGKNKGARTFAMTAPVTQAPAPVRMAMTAPVTQAATPEGYIVQFVLPKGVSLATAPEPLDPRVELREVPGQRVAVIRYSGFWSQANYDEHLATLQATLRAAQLRWTGEPTLARYNPPITPWFLRRNEIWLTLDQPDTPAADAVFFGGDILTMAGDQPQYLEALAVRGGKIVRVGSQAYVMALAGKTTQLINLQGKTLMPGFIDAHGHVADYTLRWDAPDLSPPPVGNVTSIAQIQAKLTRYLQAHPELANQTSQLVVAQGYDDGLIAERRHPTRVDLDKISKTVPIMVVHSSGHLVVANGAALRLVNFTKATPDPAGGVIRRDAQGEPNGIVEELAAYAFLPFMAPQNRPQQLATLDQILRWYASLGITTAQDGLSNPDNIALLREAAQQDRLIIDVVSFPMWKLYAKVISGEKKLEGVEIYPPGSQVSNSGRALASHQPSATVAELSPRATASIEVGVYEKGHKIGGVKITADGSPQGKTAFMTQPYLHPPEGQKADYKAYPAVEQAELDQWFDAAYQHNVQLLVHTNGDAAIDSLITAVERARAKHGAKDLRPVAIHAQLARHDQVEKMGQLGITPSFFSAHTFFWGDWHIHETFGKERAFGISPMAFAQAKGVKFTNHNDSPVVPPDMMMLAWTAVNRLSRSGVVVGPEERVSPYVAFKAMTDWSAYQYFEEASKGTLEVGKLADMVVLDHNPINVDPLHELKRIKVLETFKAGKRIYRFDPQDPAAGPPAN